MKKTALLPIIVSVLTYGQVGINTETPQKDLHVNGSLQITNELNVGGTQSTAGAAGTNGQVLISQGNGNPPVWSNLSSSGASGVLDHVDYIKGTTSVTIPVGQTLDVPGLIYTITVPSIMKSQTLAFTIVGYAPKFSSGGGGTQGVFGLYNGTEKVTSAYTTVATDHNGSLANLPIPTTLLYQTTLTPGTYTFSVKYSSWAGTVQLNKDPNNYAGYDGDNEAMLSRIQVMVFNNL